MKRNVGFVSSTGASGLVSLVSMKASIGKTAVHLRYHCHHEYQDLSKEQQQELSEWCKNNPDAHGTKPNAKKQRKPLTKKLSKHVTSLVNQQVENEIKKIAPSQNTST